MLLIFDPDPPFLRWCKIENRDFSESKCEFGLEWPKKVIGSIDDIEKVEAIGYLLHHGGELIRKPESLMSAESLPEIEKCIRFLPEYNNLTFKAAQYWMAKLPAIPHILFCDTAFFVDLPAQASTYAVPYELRKKGVRRYGGYGLCHQWAWEQTRPLLSESVGKVISIYLGDHTNIAAIEHGKPVETTIGFTSAEGILSSNSCGDIDPTVIFNLNAVGMSFAEINGLLSREGGFTGILGRECSFVDILQDGDSPDIAAVREILRYHITKYIGAFVSILGGVDAIVFLSEHLEESMSFISEICHILEFLGLERQIALNENRGWNPAEDSSGINAFCLKYSKWKIMSEKADLLLA